MLPKILYAAQIFFWVMPNEPQISFGEALEGFQGQMSVKVMLLKISYTAQIYFVGYA